MTSLEVAASTRGQSPLLTHIDDCSSLGWLAGELADDFLPCGATFTKSQLFGHIAGGAIVAVDGKEGGLVLVDDGLAVND